MGEARGYLPVRPELLLPSQHRVGLHISILVDIMRAMTQNDPDVRLLAALADPVRLSFVRQLADNDGICACDFSECCTVSQPTISHHLKVLREAGVLVSERQGTNIIYSLPPDLSHRWAPIGSSLAGLVQVALPLSQEYPS